MKPAAFQYQRVRSVDEALAALAEPGAKVIAGGQSLVPLMNFRLSRPEKLVDINGVEELFGVTQQGGVLRVGALTRHRVLASDALVGEALPVLQKAAGHIGHWAIQNRGTIGGSVVHADPAGELPAALVALEGRLVVRGPDGERAISAQDFFQGFYTTVLSDDELLVRVEFPLTSRRMGFDEVVRRPGDFALVGAFVEVGQEGGAVTWFGLLGRPERQTIDAWPSDAAGREAKFEELCRQNALDPEDEYKYPVAATVAERAYQDALKEG